MWASGTTYTVPASTKAIVKAIHVVPQKASYQILDGVLVLEAGDKIRASAGAASVLDVTVSLMEVS